MLQASTATFDPMIAGSVRPKYLSRAAVLGPASTAIRRPRAGTRGVRPAGASQKAKRTPPPAAGPETQPVAPPTDTDIRVRAYEIYLGRGDAQGDALADWLEAERELWAAFWRRLKTGAAGSGT